ncbi:MAG: hydrogenase iron-sulfur subunit [Gammaproteobacteria bacterium]|nr:hydrogenase iron-sulfur subunit [Gammaproteobacteria bacterium]
MQIVKRASQKLFLKADIVFDYAFDARNNPLKWLGAFGWFFYWIAAATGVYLYIFFDTGITNAYASVEYMTNEQWYAAGIMRSLHRYSSDALVVVVALHIFREFSMDRLRGKRFFAWLTGLPLLGFIYICGISGYWLVWDQLAQYIAVATAEWVDTLPFFAEPIANNFLNATTLGDRFFTLLVFIHIFGPLFLLVLMWVHIQRHSAARVNPPRPLALGTLAMLLVLSLAFPAVSQGPANLDVVPATVNLDWFYLPAYPLLDLVPGGQLWLYVLLAGVLLAILPWAPPEKPAPVAVVSLENCNGCGRCFNDCPFSAISMMPRSDGLAFDTEAVVNADNCLSCGICAGACPTATPFRRAKPIEPGIQLPHHPIAALRDKVVAASQRFGAGPRILVFNCDKAGADALLDDGAQLIPMPCVGMLPPSFIDFTLSRKLADGVMLAGCAESDCYYRLGDEWTSHRVAGTRDPYLRKRVPLERLRLSWLAGDAVKRRRRDLLAFRAALEEGGGE